MNTRLWHICRRFKDWYSRTSWILFTGHPNLRSARRAVECDAYKLGGRVDWYQEPFK